MEELIGTATTQQNGLLSSQLFKEYPHFVNAFNATYKIASNIANWERRPMMILYNADYLSFLDLISYVLDGTTGKLTVKVTCLSGKYDGIKYYMKNQDIYVCFTKAATNPNRAYIFSPNGVEQVGDATYIDDSFTEIV